MVQKVGKEPPETMVVLAELVAETRDSSCLDTDHPPENTFSDTIFALRTSTDRDTFLYQQHQGNLGEVCTYLARLICTDTAFVVS